jgi:hypothetical protein
METIRRFLLDYDNDNLGAFDTGRRTKLSFIEEYFFLSKLED